MYSLTGFLDLERGTSYVKHRCGSVTYTLYLRKGPRAVEGVRYERVLDVANITSSKPGSGLFGDLECQLRIALSGLCYDGIYFESVLRERFGRALKRLGYVRVNRYYGTSNYYLQTGGDDGQEHTRK